MPDSTGLTGWPAAGGAVTGISAGDSNQPRPSARRSSGLFTTTDRLPAAYNHFGYCCTVWTLLAYYTGPHGVPSPSPVTVVVLIALMLAGRLPLTLATVIAPSA